MQLEIKYSILTLIHYIIFQAPFNTVLDIDFRGRISGSNISDITIELGEIKLSSGGKAVKKSFRQLLLRLAVLSFVVEAMNKDENITKCTLIGKIFVPRGSEISIQPGWENGIRFSSSAEYRVDIVNIDEKQQNGNVTLYILFGKSPLLCNLYLTLLIFILNSCYSCLFFFAIKNLTKGMTIKQKDWSFLNIEHSDSS